MNHTADATLTEEIRISAATPSIGRVHSSSGQHSMQTNSASEPMTFANTPFEDDAEESRRFFHRRPMWRYFYIGGLVFADAAVMIAASYLGFLFNSNALDTIRQSIPVTAFIAAVCIVWLLSLLFAGAYQRHIMAEGYTLYSKLFNAIVFTIILMSAMSFMLDLRLPRTSLIISPCIAGILIIIERWLMRRVLHACRRKGQCKYPTVIVGSSLGINNALRTIHHHMDLGYSPIAVCPIAKADSEEDSYVVMPFIPDKDIENAFKLKVIPFNLHFARIAERLGAQEVFIADVLSRDSKLLHALSLAVESLGIELTMPISLADISGHRLHLRNMNEQPMLIASLPQYKMTTYIIKRIIDIICSALALVVSSPIMLAVAIAIKLDDGGPIFFSQTRIGLHGKPFRMWKFRSMVTNAEEIKAQLAEQVGQSDRFIFKLKDDPRITKVGRFIRKTSLDEFPQFFNVLKGDMSLVGPRPALPEEVQRYGSLYSTRLLVKPGITGPWQVSGRSDLSQEQSEYLDVSYIENWSITGDLAILAKTVLVVLQGTGSY